MEIGFIILAFLCLTAAATYRGLGWPEYGDGEQLDEDVQERVDRRRDKVAQESVAVYVDKRCDEILRGDGNSLQGFIDYPNRDERGRLLRSIPTITEHLPAEIKHTKVIGKITV